MELTEIGPENWTAIVSLRSNAPGLMPLTSLSVTLATETPVRTVVIAEEKRASVVARIHAACREGRQAYWVCPLIDESEELRYQAAEETTAALTAALPELKVGLVHGRMASKEKERAMAAFKAGKTQLLVATTVIEVGVDVPNATIMIVQEADRFGLAQLHQLRGRVGRGAEQSYCLLVSGPKEELTDVAHDRLEAMVQTSDGFELAERDLEIRGEGQLLGARQSGLSDLHFTRLRQDTRLLERARGVARSLSDEGELVTAVDRLLGVSEHIGDS